MDLNLLIYFSFKLIEIFKKLKLVNICFRPWHPKVSVRDIFVNLPLENFKTIFNICVLGIQPLYILTTIWPEEHWNYIKWFR